MKILIIGGTRFLGYHVAKTAIARDHEVTLFHRGKHSTEELKDAETIQGDRHTGLEKLQGRRWDAVVDTSGMLPRAVRAAAQALSNAVDRYVFISTQNVYADVSTPGVDETSPLAKLTDEQLDQANAIDTSGEPSYGKLYGGLKVLCEQAVEEVMPQRVLNIRPGLIVGPNDYTDRFSYWVARVAQGGEVLSPGRHDRPIQFIDVRDLADWIVTMIERKGTGVYNANGLPDTFTMENLLDECKAVSNSDAWFTWVSEDFLLRHEVAAWSDMPLWLPESAPALKGFMFVNTDKAVAAGLSFSPLRNTVRDTLTWLRSIDLHGNLKAGIDRDKEKVLLEKWHEAPAH